jgi:hypothetical protein
MALGPNLIAEVLLRGIQSPGKARLGRSRGCLRMMIEVLEKNAVDWPLLLGVSQSKIMLLRSDEAAALPGSQSEVDTIGMISKVLQHTQTHFVENGGDFEFVKLIGQAQLSDFGQAI